MKYVKMMPKKLKGLIWGIAGFSLWVGANLIEIPSSKTMEILLAGVLLGIGGLCFLSAYRELFRKRNP